MRGYSAEKLLTNPYIYDKIILINYSKTEVNMKNKLRLISILLVILLLASFWGCSMPGIGTDSGEATSEKATTTLPPEDIVIEGTTWDEGIEYETETEFPDPFTEPVPVTTPDPVVTDCPFYPTAEFGGEPVRILYGSDAERNEFNAEEIPDLVEGYAYQRNVDTEKHLGVKLEWTGVASNASHAAEYIQFAENMHAAGEPFDIYVATRRAMGQMLTKSLLQDLNQIKDGYIDLSKPWYPATLREDLTVGGADFLVTGDISANALLQMNAIFYNVEFAEAWGRKDIASMVMDGTWTLDALIELSQGIYVDQDNSGSKTATDDYGFTQATYLDSDAFYSGSGLKFFETDPTGNSFVMTSADLTLTKAAYLNEKLYSFFEDPSSYVGSPYSLDGNYTLPFAEGRALFCHGTLSMTDNGIFTAGYSGQRYLIFDFEYGILPIPKYDTEQEEYITTLSNKAVFWGIHNYSTAERALMSSAVIEIMAYKGYTEIAHAVFENVMKYRYRNANDENSAIFDIMRSSIRVDIGKLFSENTESLPSTFANGVRSSANHWIMSVTNSQYKVKLQRGESELNRLIEYALINQNH